MDWKQLLSNPWTWAVVIIIVIGLIVLSSVYGVQLNKCNNDKKNLETQIPPVMDTMTSQENLSMQEHLRAQEHISLGNELAKTIRKVNNKSNEASKLQKMKNIIAMESAHESGLNQVGQTGLNQVGQTGLTDLHYSEKAEISAIDNNINAGRAAPKGVDYSPKTAILAALSAQTENYRRENEHLSDRKEANMRVAAQEDELANVVTGMEGLALEKFQSTGVEHLSGLEDVLSGAEHFVTGLEDVLTGAEHLTADDDYIEDTDEVVSDRVSQGDIVKVIQAKPKSCKKVYNRGNNKEYFCGRRIFDVNNEICPFEDRYGKDSVCNENHPSKKAFGRRDKVYVDVSQYMRNYEENVHDPSYYHTLY